MRLIALSRRQSSPERSHVLEAMAEAIRAVDPRTVLRAHMTLRANELRIDSKTYDLSRYDRVLVIGAGKATGLMAAETERILGKRITDGWVNVPGPLSPTVGTKRVRQHVASHPLPSSSGRWGVERMLAIVGRPSRRDLVICLLSGGGSALMPLPIDGLGLEDKKTTTELLLMSGARIEETNAVRKHLSAIKGGRLAERLWPATVVSLMISDVVADRLDSIASGPLSPDETTFGQAREILKRYELWDKVPSPIREIIRKGERELIPETPKHKSRVFKRVHNFIVGNARDSCLAAASSLRRRNYRPLILSTRLQGEARHVGNVLGSILSRPSLPKFSLEHPFAIVAAGETTVSVKGNGKGGRNQELVLSAAMGLQGKGRFALASIDTDGIDGFTPAAGAIATGETVDLARRKKLDPSSFLENNDSFNFFKPLNSLIMTGRTGTNVGDVFVGVAR